jgi:parvulin-like peptidyl-prolyl isomerase
MKSQGITGDCGLRGMLTARIQQEKFVAKQIAPLVAITDAQARQWFDRNRDALTIPEQVEARHLFIPTLDQAPEAAKAKLAAALADLTAMRKDFATLAKEISDDPATQNTGGQLGWMTRDRLPADFAAPVFSLPLHQPSLVRSRIGWHLVEVTAHKPAEPQSFDQAKPEILAALETIQRRHAVTQCRTALRRLEASHIQVYHELMR